MRSDRKVGTAVLWLGAAAGLVATGGFSQPAGAQVYLPLPATDPAVLPADQVQLLPGALQHPRLLVTPADLTTFKADALSSPFYPKLTSYLLNPPSVPAPGVIPSWVTNDTEAQRQGFWRAPSVALHYTLTDNSSSFTKAKGYMDRFLEQENWQTGAELDSGMGAGNILVGAALTYDSLYDDLTPAYRDQYRTKLLNQARKMYYNGHQRPAGGPGGNYYWQQDPQNNHRWHRDAGLTLAALAVADPTKSDDDWILSKTKKELDYVHQWLSPDGSNHEGPSYAAFGTSHLVLAFDAADRVLGTNYMDHDFFKNSADFRLATLTPGFGQVFAFGDGGKSSFGIYNNYALLTASHHGQADQLAALKTFADAKPDAFAYGWMSTPWFDKDLAATGSINNLSKKHVFEDIGFASVRDGWATNDVALSFKSGIYGGEKLNEYRNANGFRYINVAHDDPDANSFQIYARGKLIAQPDGYATTTKLTAAHNTILVNGTGQKGEGSSWTQPLSGADRDMSNLAGITMFDDRGDITIIEGEAGNAYKNSLTRYRRTSAFNEGKYILVLDDIRAAVNRSITWLVQSESIDVIDPANGKYALRTGGVSVPFILDGNVDYTAAVTTSVAQERGASLNLKQLQATASTSQWRTAALFDAWGLGNLDLSFVPISALVTELHISGPGFTDVWLWDSTNIDTLLTLLTGRLPGDANNDGRVDVTDLGILAANFRMPVTGGEDDADFDLSGFVDVTDLGILAANFRAGTTAFASAAAGFGLPAIPEPTALAGLALLGLLAKRRRK